MLVDNYDEFVRSRNLSAPMPREKSEDILIYGLVGELGALTNAVKRRLLAEADDLPWNVRTAEVVEELGDCLWYWSALCELYDSGSAAVLKADIQQLRDRLTDTTAEAQMFRDAVGPERLRAFSAGVKTFASLSKLNFNGYQRLAFQTRRTEGRTLVSVCLTVLSQLGAELLRLKFPEVEKQINAVIERRDVKTILGETAWHLSAIASSYEIGMDDVAVENRKKVNRRLNASAPTALHDETFPIHERFPRKFEVAFVMASSSRLRMYMNGKRLGDELTDNSYEDDGYRYHDVMHLAGVANLGWSPVLRDLLKKKRKSNQKVDEVEDGARARIVEEAVIKAIHSEGLRVSAPRRRLARGRPVQLFRSKHEITFQFLDFIANLTTGLEVTKNQFWEWENAIIQGHEVFCELRKEEQGTVTVDLEMRCISFRPEVYVDSPGAVMGMGAAAVDSSRYEASRRRTLEATDWAGERRELLRSGASERDIAERVATKTAILNALDVSPTSANYGDLDVTVLGRGLSVRARGAVRDAMWRRKIISFRTTVSEAGTIVYCTAIAISDPADAAM